MTELEQIQKYIYDKRQNYLRRANEIRADYNRENNTKLSYVGRQIFELLQNADDCCEKDSNGLPKKDAEIKVKFELRDHLLIIQNTGEPFVPRGILSLMDTDSSSKYVGTIGCKGLGFRSVLNWAEDIYIYTRSFIVNFSQERAKEQLDYYKANCAKTYVEELNAIDRISVLNAVEAWYDVEEVNQWLDEGYSTSIVLHCKQSELESIRRQLLELRFEELLFLEHVRYIDIVVDGQIRKIQSNKDGEKIIIQDGDQCSFWDVWKEKGTLIHDDGNEKHYELAIAYNQDETERERIRKEGYLYSFFKTDIRMPFPFLVHGTFDLSPDRNSLYKQNFDNVVLLDKLIDFIGRKAAELAANSVGCDYDALKFILPAEPISFLDGEYNFSKKLKEKVKQYKLFPAINDNYVSFGDNPKYSDRRFDELVNPSTFSTLLKNCDDTVISNYLREVGIVFYGCSELAELLNEDADAYVSEDKNVELLVLFFQQFSYPQYLPNLLVDSQGNRITSSNTTIFVSGESVKNFVLPKWCEMCFLNAELQQQLQSAWGYKSGRELVGRLGLFGCAEYSFNRVLGELISQSKDAKDKVAELLSWLYSEWIKNGHKFESLPPNLNVRCFSRNGEIVFCKKCYFGREYDNAVGERIASHLKEAVFVADCQSLGFDVQDVKIVTSFLSQLGVQTFPQISVEELDWNEQSEYRSYNSQTFITVKAGCEWLTHNELFCNYPRVIKVSTIVGIDDVLKNADFYDVLYWIQNDEDLRRHVVSELEIDSTSYMEGRPYKAKYPKRAIYDQMRSYLRMKFTQTAWIPTVSGTRTNCGNCILASNALSPIVEMVNLDHGEMLKYFGKPMKKQVELLLSNLGVAEDVDGLPKEKIYDVLLQLPTLDQDKLSLGQHVYARINRKFDKASVDELIQNNPFYDKFLQEGRVLCAFNGGKEYVPVKDAYYVDRKIYSDDILDKYPTIILNYRQGDDKIPRIFGVKSIRDIGEIKVDFVPHERNEEFQKDYKQKLPYLYAKRIKYDKGSALQILREGKIILVESATTTHYVGDVKNVGELKDYELIYTDKVAYIKVPKDATLETLRGNMDFKSTLAEVVITMLKVEGDKDGYIIIFGCATNREIEEYFKNNGDNTFEDINLALQRFSVTPQDYREAFWTGVSRATGIEREMLYDKYGFWLPHDFDYVHLDVLQNALHVVNLFRELNIDVKDYNDKTYHSISLKAYYCVQLGELKQKYRAQYFSYKLTQLVQRDADTREFNDVVSTYSLSEIAVENSVDFDVRGAFEQILGVTLDELANYGTDYEPLLRQLRSPKVEEAPATAVPSATTAGEKSTVDFAKLHAEIANTTDGEFLILCGSETQEHNGEGGHAGHTHKGTVPDGINDLKEMIGFIAESKVYNTLKAKLQDQLALRWVSGNAVRAKEISQEEGDDAIGYDMWYYDESGVHYVEVKGSANNFEFTISKNELLCAQKYPDQYEIWFVFVKGGQASTPFNLGNVFSFSNGEDFFHNKKFSVEQNGYKLKINPSGFAKSNED